MSYGSFAFGSGTFGGGVPDWSVHLDLSPLSREQSIIDIVSFVDERVISDLYRDPSSLKTIDRRHFEDVIAQLFHGFGYEVELTKRTRDGGKDIIAIARHEFQARYLIECKRPDPGHPVALATVRELYGVKIDDLATKAILVTTTSLTKDAREFIQRHKWELEGKEYDDIIEWLKRYEVLRGRQFGT